MLAKALVGLASRLVPTSTSLDFRLAGVIFNPFQRGLCLIPRLVPNSTSFGFRLTEVNFNPFQRGLFDVDDDGWLGSLGFADSCWRVLLSSLDFFEAIAAASAAKGEDWLACDIVCRNLTVKVKLAEDKSKNQSIVL